MISKNKEPLNESIAPRVPKDLVSAPFFAARPQDKPRYLNIGDVRWGIGVEHPTNHRPSPALDIRHGRACFALLSFRERAQGRDIEFSIYEFSRRYANSCGGKFCRNLLEILFDLRDTWISREWRNGHETRREMFTIIGDIKVHQKGIRRSDAKEADGIQLDLELDRITLSPEFFDLLEDWCNLSRIRLDVLKSMRSNLAQAIYSYIPYRAAGRTKSTPYEITAESILQQVSARVPPAKSSRAKVFLQHSASVIRQLDGAETLDGVLRVSIKETIDRRDYKLLFWEERVASREDRTTATKTSYTSQMRLIEPSTHHNSSKKLSKSKILELERKGIQFSGYEDFFELMHALLGEDRFESIARTSASGVSECEGSKFIHQRFLNALIKEAARVSSNFPTSDT
ncbi:hypothetical protein [Pelagicoccus sp. SDUM812005]|uniref:hypothetical protein n=1 Tax=Pelagicoccus sp. SDUM812005 TaxID=3041257 RepID=UPI00280E5E40|nr:hypothetical protein [Pelagicoccus sp. SDUM812005]MDQ8182713.1 hypothetical protein [Pelagicoccus sp. SDUM812005]